MGSIRAVHPERSVLRIYFAMFLASHLQVEAGILQPHVLIQPTIVRLAIRNAVLLLSYLLDGLNLSCVNSHSQPSCSRLQ